MMKFLVTFQSVIEVERVYECDDEDEARSLAGMDAEDGQIGHSYERQAIGGDVISCVKMD